MICLKGCPRCGGDLFLDRAETPPALTCLQCSASLPAGQRAQSGRPFVRPQRPALIGTARAAS